MMVVPPPDRFAIERKKKINAEAPDVAKAIISSANDFHEIANEFKTLMKLKAQSLQIQMQTQVRSQTQQVPVVEGDALFNLFRHEWLLLTIKQQDDLFIEILDIMETYQSTN